MQVLSSTGAACLARAFAENLRFSIGFLQKLRIELRRAGRRAAIWLDSSCAATVVAADNPVRSCSRRLVHGGPGWP